MVNRLEQMENQDYLLVLDNVYQQYDNRIILNGINLKLRPAEFLTVVGPTGCGKSTVCNPS